MEQPPRVDNRTAIPWMRSVIDTLTATDRDSFLVATAAPAGIPIEVRFDDPALAETYLSRLVGRDTTLPPQAVIYVINGNTAALKQVPRWDHAAGDPSRFQAELRSAGLRAAYPQRSWRFYDEARRIGVQLAASGSDLAPWDAGAPLRYHLHWILEDAGIILTHAASLGAMSPYAGLVRDLPCFRIALSPDAGLNGHALRRLLESLPTTGGGR